MAVGRSGQPISKTTLIAKAVGDLTLTSLPLPVSLRDHYVADDRHR
jgi:hypothetical protein